MAPYGCQATQLIGSARSDENIPYALPADVLQEIIKHLPNVVIGDAEHNWKA